MGPVLQLEKNVYTISVIYSKEMNLFSFANKAFSESSNCAYLDKLSSESSDLAVFVNYCFCSQTLKPDNDFDNKTCLLKDHVLVIFCLAVCHFL